MMNDPSASKVTRMQAAVALAKLPPEPSSRAEVVPVPMRILSIPRDYIVWADGTIRPRPPEIDPNAPIVDGIDITDEIAAGTWKGTTPPTSVKPSSSEPRLPVHDEDHLEPAAPLPVTTTDPTPNVTKLRPKERAYTEGSHHDHSRRPSAMDPFTHKPRDPFDAA
jgi:hypothetical protein